MATNSPREILIHCSDVSWKSSWDQFKSINSYHRAEGFLRSLAGYFVGYHRLITGGNNYKCKEDFEEGCHCNQLFEDGVSMNLRSLGICVGFDGDIEQMHPDLYALLQKQIWAWQDRYVISSSRVRFHHYYNKAKTCPGKLLDDRWLANLLDRRIVDSSQTPPSSPPAPEAKPADQCEKQQAIISKQNELITAFDKLINFIFPH